jgi:transcription elongation factor GreA
MGDLSENAAYTQAKARVGGIDRRIMEIQERLRTAIIVSPGATADGRVRIGTTVDVEVRGNQRTYVVTGSTEADPSAGRLSHLSPLGGALMGKKVGDTATITGPAGTAVEYRVVAVR